MVNFLQYLVTSEFIYITTLIDLFLCELGQFYAFEKARHLGQNSVDRCLRQFKIVLLQQLEKVRDSPLSLSLSLSLSISSA
jgi:hypothetical protein